jgi:hypothetical protein
MLSDNIEYDTIGSNEYNEIHQTNIANEGVVKNVANTHHTVSGK